MIKRIVLVIALVSVLAVSGYEVFKINDNYEQEAKIHGQMLAYKPDEAITDAPVVNQSILNLQAVNSDVVGWISIPDTSIDYPFVQSSDNDFYLRRDINKEYAFAGTVFMDYRCASDFSSDNTIIYGHHMQNESMFGALESFNVKSFFDNNKYGYIYLSNANYTLEFFAFMVTGADDGVVDRVSLNPEYFDYVKENARYFRDIGLEKFDRIVTLYTCAYEFDDARMVLIGRIKGD